MFIQYAGAVPTAVRFTTAADSTTAANTNHVSHANRTRTRASTTTKAAHSITVASFRYETACHITTSRTITAYIKAPRTTHSKDTRASYLSATTASVFRTEPASNTKSSFLYTRAASTTALDPTTSHYRASDRSESRPLVHVPTHHSAILLYYGSLCTSTLGDQRSTNTLRFSLLDLDHYGSGLGLRSNCYNGVCVPRA